MRNLKVLTLAMVVVLAMSAVAAAGVSASNFTASKYPTEATSTSEKGNDDFKTEAGSVECKVTRKFDPLVAESETITVTLTYHACQAFGFLSATVKTNGCDELWHTNGMKWTVCPIESEIEIVASTCEIKIGSQSELASISLSNSGSGISAKENVSGIAYTVTKDGFLCPFNGTGEKTGATYTQNASVQISSTNGATIDIG